MKAKIKLNISAVILILLTVFFNGKIGRHVILSEISYNADVMRAVNPKLEIKNYQYQLNKLDSQQTAADNEVYQQASAYAVVDFDSGDVIKSKNINIPLPIASLTKIMTAVVALDLAQSDEIFTVSVKASKAVPTKIGIIPGQKLTLEELLDALLLTSANDVAEMIKEGIDSKYGSPVFIKAMNNKAKFLGLLNTSFDNPQGFDGPDNYSSSADMILLSRYALTKYPLIAAIVKKDYQLLPKNKNHKQYDLYNWNGLLGVYPEVQGVKIGNTDKAGKTTVVLARRNGVKLLTVVLGAPSVLKRDLWAAKLLDIGFNNLKGLQMVGVGEDMLKEKYNTWKYWN